MNLKMVATLVALIVLSTVGNSQDANLQKYGSLSRQQTVRDNLRLRDAALELRIEENRRAMVRRNTPTPVVPVVIVSRSRSTIVGYTSGRSTLCVRDTSCYYRGRR